jgi:hypothetical protein
VGRTEHAEADPPRRGPAHPRRGGEAQGPGLPHKARLYHSNLFKLFFFIKQKAQQSVNLYIYSAYYTYYYCKYAVCTVHLPAVACCWLLARSAFFCGFGLFLCARPVSVLYNLHN